MSKSLKNKSKTTVVCLKGQAGQKLNKDEVYVGRKIKLGGWDLPQTPYANKYKGRNPVASYYRWLMESDQEELREEIKEELKDKKLACWCHNSGDIEIHCHADALAAVADNEMNKSLEIALKEEEELFTKVKEDKNSFEVSLETIETLSYQDRIIGMFTAVFMGDAKGALYEFGKDHPKFTDKIQDRLTVNNRYDKEDNVTYGLGQVTDDSEMLCVLSGHLVDQFELLEKKKKKSGEKIEKIDAEKLASLYMEWANSGTSAMGKNTKELFGGIKTLKGFEAHYRKKFGFDPSYNKKQELETDAAENQLSNGSLMRCAVLSLLKDNSLIYRDIYLSNPSSIVESMEDDYLTGLRMALKGESSKDILKFFLQENINRNSIHQSIIDDIKNDVKRELINKKSKGKIIEGKGSIMSSFYATLWALKYYINELRTKKKVAIFNIYKKLIEEFPGSDTDTNCAIAGALIGAILGYKTMTFNKDYTYNCDIIFNIEEETDRPRPLEYHPARMYELFPLLFKMYEKYNLNE